jgi:integrase
MERSKKPASPATWEASALLRDFYLAMFLPSARRRLSKKRIETYDSALRRFERFVGGKPQLGSVDNLLLQEFAQHLFKRQREGKGYAYGVSKQHARQLAGCIRQIVRAWSGDRLPHRLPLPPADPGTVRHYAETVYIREVLFDAKRHTQKKVVGVMRKLREHLGRDILLSEQTDSLAAGFFRVLLDQGKPASTINSGYRAPWFCVWNHAYFRDLVARPPRTKKLKETINAPDSLTIAEARRLIEAATCYRPGESYGDIRCNLWWRACLLTLWVTGLRRGSLLSIRRDDVDFENGLVYVPGENMKTGRAQNFHLGADALEAIGQIWLPRRELLFESCWGVRTMTDHLAEIFKAAEIRPSRRKGMHLFHRLRRTTATFVAAGSSVAVASALLGHSERAVTMRYVDPSKVGAPRLDGILPTLLDIRRPPAAAG